MDIQETTSGLLGGGWRRWKDLLSFIGPRKYSFYQGLICVLQCHPSGCLTDLFIQMSVIMLLKQTLNNIFEFTVPWVEHFLPVTPPTPKPCLLHLITSFLLVCSFFSWVKNCLSRSTVNKLQRKCGQCYRKSCRDESGYVEQCDVCKLQDWLRNYHLADTNAFSLFNEFLEMGQSMLFSSFPLLFAFFLHFNCFCLLQLGNMFFYFSSHPVCVNIHLFLSFAHKVSTHNRKMPLLSLQSKKLILRWNFFLVSVNKRFLNFKYK